MQYRKQGGTLRDQAADEQRVGARSIVSLALAIIVIHCLILAAPGFFSHDEWERFDAQSIQGLGNYARSVTHINAGHDFGTPVRPIGFLEEGFSASWMETLPFVPHLIDVLLHTSVALLLLATLRAASLSARTSLLAALLFSASPLTTMATGWVGASFDLWYTFFTVAACLVALNICNKGTPSPLHLGLLAAATGCALLSKETAIVLPGVVALATIGYFLHTEHKTNWHLVASVFSTCTAVVLAYLWMRLPALRETFSGTPTSSYIPGAGNVLRNLAGYIAYPFLFGISEMANFPVVEQRIVVAALTIHALLAGALTKRFGWSAALLYVAAYFIFLIPVLPLPGGGSHYLYASAIPMAIAIAVLLQAEWAQRNHVSLCVLLAMVALLTTHTWRNELFLYRTALCQTRFITSLDTRLALEASKGTRTLIIRPDADAPAHVGLRAIHGRARYAGGSQPEVTFDATRATQFGDKNVTVAMNRRCTIR
jgi:hypothetical protein